MPALRPTLRSRVVGTAREYRPLGDTREILKLLRAYAESTGRAVFPFVVFTHRLDFPQSVIRKPSAEASGLVRSRGCGPVSCGMLVGGRGRGGCERRGIEHHHG